MMKLLRGRKRRARDLSIVFSVDSLEHEAGGHLDSSRRDGLLLSAVEVLVGC